ncbi:MAG: HAMP domain-containing histidine kinase [Ruminococcaceae bacterium]|nr:HAMP domain-containing histidine kinase [Oscillospiraceae bacterium]
MKKGILPDNLTLRVKIHIYVMAFLGALLVTLWLIQVVFFNGIYRQVKRNEVMQVAVVMENVINDIYPVEQLVGTVAEKEVCIIVYDAEMNQVQSLDGPRSCVIHKMSHTEQVDAIQRVLGDHTRQFLEYEQEEDLTYRLVTRAASSEFRIFKEKGAPQIILYAKEIVDKNGDKYTILINAQDEPVEAIITTTRTVLSLVTIFSLVMAWFLILLMARSISEPIEEINEKAKVLAGGRYDIDFKAKGYREINELSDTMTYTANELSNLERLRQEFIANVSHDLRTPLTMIGGYAEVMRDIPGENSAENAQVIIDETKRLSNMVSDVLNLSKVQSGAEKPDMKRYNFTESIKAIIQNVTELLKGEGYNIIFEYDEDVEVVADQTLINQCFYNLLTNAISYSVDRKDVIVKQTVENNKVKIEVTDFGKGISQSDIPYIWERYYKNKSGRVKNIKSTGLGLSIVKTFITVHGGEYGVYSTEGEGSTFWFSINIE